jgi:hypothetical protein
MIRFEFWKVFPTIDLGHLAGTGDKPRKLTDAAARS